MKGTPYEHAMLAFRWVHTNEPLWADFPRYWMAFNALYNSVRAKDESEDSAIASVIRVFLDEAAAQTCLNRIDDGCIANLVAIPPGDDRLSPSDPNYRAKTTALIQLYETRLDPTERLCALMRIVYQIRCNLVHGSKDPEVMRDQELVRSCTPILLVVVQNLEAIMENHHTIPNANK